MHDIAQKTYDAMTVNLDEFIAGVRELQEKFLAQAIAIKAQDDAQMIDRIRGWRGEPTPKPIPPKSDDGQKSMFDDAPGVDA